MGVYVHREDAPPADPEQIRRISLALEMGWPVCEALGSTRLDDCVSARVRFRPRERLVTDRIASDVSRAELVERLGYALSHLAEYDARTTPAFL